jgi:hypothetical protein
MRQVRARIEETTMRCGIFAALFGSSALIAGAALAQKAGPADVCQELLIYAEMKATQPPVSPPGQASTPAGAALPRADGQATGTQGGGSTSPSSSSNMRSQAATPPTAPIGTGAAPEAAASPHASGPSDGGAGATLAGTPDTPAELRLAGGVTLQQLRDTAKSSERQGCRETVQMLRRAGADLPAALIALAAYEPDPAKRQ